MPNLNRLEAEYILPKVAEFHLFKYYCYHNDYTQLHPRSSLSIYSIIRRFKLYTIKHPVIMNFFRIIISAILSFKLFIYLIKCTFETGLDTVPTRQTQSSAVLFFEHLWSLFSNLSLDYLTSYLVHIHRSVTLVTSNSVLPQTHKGLKHVTRVQRSWIFTFTIFGNLSDRYPFSTQWLLRDHHTDVLRQEFCISGLKIHR